MHIAYAGHNLKKLFKAYPASFNVIAFESILTAKQPDIIRKIVTPKLPKNS